MRVFVSVLSIDDGTLYQEQKTFEVEGTDVQEVGTPFHYDAANGKGYQEVDGRHVALTSYAAFGNDIASARDAADFWCYMACKAYEKSHNMEIL